MKILLVGSTGTVGSRVASTLTARGHEVLAAHRASTDLPVDIEDLNSIDALVARVGTLDAVACAAGTTPFAPLGEVTRDQWIAGLTNKFLGQVELIQRSRSALRDRGSFTVISGVLAHEPIPSGAVASSVNGALEAYVGAAAIELDRGHRINAVSPTVLTESLDVYDFFFPGFPPTTADAVAQAYVRSIEGAETGRVFRV